MAFHALADYQNHVIGWLQWEQSSLGDGAVVRFPRIWMSSGECRLRITLANGESTTNVAIEAGKAISDILIEMKARVVQANQAGLDADSRTVLQNDYDALRNQIKTIVATAEFNSVNLIKTDGTNFAVLSTVDGSTIIVTAQDLSVTALGISAANLTTSASANLALTSINTAITAVSNGLASLGAAAKRVDIQTDFTTQLVDILRVGAKCASKIRR